MFQASAHCAKYMRTIACPTLDRLMHFVGWRQLKLAALQQRKPTRLQLRQRWNRTVGGTQEPNKPQAGANPWIERVQITRNSREPLVQKWNLRIEARAEDHQIGLETATVV